MASYETVTVVNRTSKPLNGTWDGRQYIIPPGESKFPKLEALGLRYQNRIMGVGTPLEDWGQKSDYLIGILESGDDCSPLEQSNAVQRWDTSIMSAGKDIEVVRGKSNMYAGGTNRLPVETAFDKP